MWSLSLEEWHTNSHTMNLWNRGKIQSQGHGGCECGTLYRKAWSPPRILQQHSSVKSRCGMRELESLHFKLQPHRGRSWWQVQGSTKGTGDRAQKFHYEVILVHLSTFFCGDSLLCWKHLQATCRISRERTLAHKEQDCSSIRLVTCSSRTNCLGPSYCLFSVYWTFRSLYFLFNIHNNYNVIRHTFGSSHNV